MEHIYHIFKYDNHQNHNSIEWIFQDSGEGIIVYF